MSLTIEIKVVPSSGRQALTLDKSGTIKCYLKNPPEDGKANQELIKFLSSSLQLPQYEVTIVAGATSRKKIIKIQRNISLDQMLQAFGLIRQKSLLD